MITASPSLPETAPGAATVTTRRVLMLGSWDDGPGYPRARSLLAALDHMQAPMRAVRVPSALPATARRRTALRPWLWPWAVAALARDRGRLRRALRGAVGDFAPDVVLVPYPGHAAVRAVRAGFTGRVVLDLFLSLHETVVGDYGLVAPGSLPARALAGIDRRACAAADAVLVDTPQHADRVAEVTGLPRERFFAVPVCEPEAPAAMDYVPPSAGEPLRVLFFGNGVPLHGLPVLVEAVRRCGPRVHLEVVGGSPADRQHIARLQHPSIELGPTFVGRDPLAHRLARAHLVAGVFGTSRKAAAVVPFKVVLGLAAGRPVLTADTPAIRAALRPDDDVLVVAAGDADALQRRLLELAGAPQLLAAVAGRARAAHDSGFSVPAVARRLQEVL